MAANQMFRSYLRYAITNSSHYGSTGRAREAGLLFQTEHLARNGIDFIQLREKDLDPESLLRLARRMLEVLRKVNATTRLLINSRVDIAAAAGAHGVHLPSGDGELTPAQARRVLRAAEPIVSVACHTLADIENARNNAAGIILFGPVFGKFIDGNMVVPGTGLSLFAEACSRAGDIPVLALGGVTLENSAACIDEGAKGIAAIRLFQRRTE